MAGRLYDRRKWRRLRARVLRHEPICRACMERGAIRTAREVDHIIPLRDGGEPLDPANLQALCSECHARKTRNVEQLGRERVPQKGADASGRPLDPGHWWNRK